MQPHLCAGVTQKQAQKPARKSALQVNSSMSVTSAPLLHLLLHTFIASHVLLSDESLICHPPPPFALFLRLQGPGSPPGGLMEHPPALTFAEVSRSLCRWNDPESLAVIFTFAMTRHPQCLDDGQGADERRGRKERQERSCWLRDNEGVLIYILLFSGALNSLFSCLTT